MCPAPLQERNVGRSFKNHCSHVSPLSCYISSSICILYVTLPLCHAVLCCAVLCCAVLCCSAVMCSFLVLTTRAQHIEQLQHMSGICSQHIVGFHSMKMTRSNFQVKFGTSRRQIGCCSCYCGAKTLTAPASEGKSLMQLASFVQIPLLLHVFLNLSLQVPLPKQAPNTAALVCLSVMRTRTQVDAWRCRSSCHHSACGPAVPARIPQVGPLHHLLLYTSDALPALPLPPC